MGVLTNLLQRFDLFGARFPALNYRGTDKVTTNVGGFLSLTIITLTLSYALVKFERILGLKNP